MSVRRQRRAMFGTAAAAILVSALGVAAPLAVKSPRQAAAETGPPPRTVLTAPVERRVLRDTVVLRGTVTAATVVEVKPAAGEETTRTIVTAIRARQGEQIVAGQVIVEVSGRPLVALPGPVPAYRDLRPGSAGPDIAALQAALRGLGYRTGGDRKDFFGPGTKAALTAFYNAAGYPVPTTGRADEELVNGARSRVGAAERGLSAAREALEEAKRKAAAEPTPPPSGTSDAVAAAVRQLRLAEEDLPVAREDLAKLEARTGPMLPAREVVFLPEFPAQVVSLTARVGTEVATDQPLVTLSSGALVAQTRVDPAQRELMKPGLEVRILSELLGVTATGVIGAIGGLQQDQKAGPTHAVTITPLQPFDPALAGADVRLTVQAASTAGEVLVVPLAAISAGADGRTSVVRVLPDGGEERVEVVPGVSGDGYVEIRPAAGAISAGDRVVIGR